MADYGTVFRPTAARKLEPAWRMVPRASPSGLCVQLNPGDPRRGSFSPRRRGPYLWVPLSDQRLLGVFGWFSELAKHEVGDRLERDPIPSLRIDREMPQPFGRAVDPLRFDIPSGSVVERSRRQIWNRSGVNFRHLRRYIAESEVHKAEALPAAPAAHPSQQPSG